MLRYFKIDIVIKSIALVVSFLLLIEYLGSKTDNAEVKNAVTEVNKVLAEQEQANAEVKAKVSGEYEEIF